MAGTASSGDAAGKRAGDDAARAQAPRSFFRVRATLLLLSALVVSAVCLGVWREIRDDRDLAEANARKQAQLLADAAAFHVALAFKLADGAANEAAFAAEEALRDKRPLSGERAGESLGGLVARAAAEADPINNVAVVDLNGLTVVDSAGKTPVPSVSDREFFAVHQQNAGPPVYVSQPLRCRWVDGWCVVVSRRVNAPDGAFGGVAYATLDLGWLERSFAGFDVGEDGFVLVWRRDGKVLSRTPRDFGMTVGAAGLLDGSSHNGDNAPNGESRRRSPVDGVARWIVSQPVDGAPLSVAVGLAERDVLAAWAATAPRQIAAGAAVAGLTVLLTLILLIYLKRLELADGALRDGQRRIRALFDSTFEYIAMLTVDGDVLSANQGLLKVADQAPSSKLSPDGPIGERFWALEPWRLSPATTRQVREGVRRAALGELVRFECPMRTPDGLRMVDMSIKPIGDDRGGVALLIAEARDVTSRKRNEDDLRASEARVRSYFEAAMDGIVVVDRRGRFIDVNPAACRMFGLQRTAMTEMSLADVLPTEDSPAAATHLAQVNALGAYRGELRFRRADGEARAAEVSAVRLEGDGYLGVFRDVTRQRSEEAALRAGNARIAALLRAIPDLVMLMDRSGLFLEVVTPPSDDRLTITANRLLGRRPADILPADVARRMTAAVEAAAAFRHADTVEFQLDLADGLRWFEARFSAIADGPDAAGPATAGHVLQITRDVTERVEAAARLADAKEQAEAANRTKSAFLATMSHELRTPLNAVIGFSEIMRSEMFGPIGNARYAGYVESIHESGGHLLSLINDVLDISKLEAGKYVLEEAWVELPDMVESCCALADSAAVAGSLRLERVAPADMPLLLCDERALRQVLLNLLSNAVKFTPPGGVVRVSARWNPETGVVVSIADTGIGIPPDALARIAQPFQQVDSSIARRFGGTGLGLAISRNLMELHGGRLDVDSVENQGTTVSAVFPPSRLSSTAGATMRLSSPGADPTSGAAA